MILFQLLDDLTNDYFKEWCLSTDYSELVFLFLQCSNYLSGISYYTGLNEVVTGCVAQFIIILLQKHHEMEY